MEKLGDVLNKLPIKGKPPEANGVGASFKPAPADGPDAPAPACPRCHGLGWVRHQVPVTHPDFGKVFPCTCQLGQMQSTRNADLLRYSGLQHMARFTFGTLAPEGKGSASGGPEERRQFQKALAAAQSYAKAPAGWLVLTGPSGCGKTHLAAAIAHRLLESGHQAFFASVPDLLDQFRASFAPSSPDASGAGSQTLPYSDLFQRVANAPVLALDDLGAHSGTPWAQEKLLQLLNQRYNLLLPTVITLSVPLSQLDERLRSRLGDATVAKVVEVASRRDEARVCIGRSEESLAHLRFSSFEVHDPKWTKNNPENAKNLREARNSFEAFASDPFGWLLLIGTTLTGKTHLLASVFNDRKDMGQPVAYAWVPALLEELRSAFSPGSAVTYEELFEQVREAPLLLLDDLGAEYPSEWAKEKLYQLLVHRYDSRLPTAIATRLEGEDLKSKLSPALISRFFSDEATVKQLRTSVFERRRKK